MTSEEMTQFCPGGHVTDVQCASRQGYLVGGGGGGGGYWGLLCSLRDGFVCRNDAVAPATCNDYKIRYFCQCEATGNDEVLLASLQSNRFQQSPVTSQNMTFYNSTGAGVTLHDVSSMDDGMYAVVINVMEHHYVRAYTHLTLLRVDDPSHPCKPAPSSLPPSLSSPVKTRSPGDHHHVTPQNVPIG
ncbi:uncharacterized protein LOC143285632 [Babylonia areolata]|uniref:uncharacterized protein LOC143285632 n=1 Tax=Babylonia areolata TaxID=304850 RepID=UPI003FD08450